MQAVKKGRTGVRVWTLGAAMLAVVGIVAFVTLGPDEAEVPRLPLGGETRAILSPQLYSGATQVAYAVAQRYPELMDKIYCYCECSRPPNFHKSLRSCFATRHGAG